jgi:hypothetical protein
MKREKSLTRLFDGALKEGIVHVPLGHRYGEEGSYIIAETNERNVSVFETNSADNSAVFVIRVGNDCIEIPEKCMGLEEPEHLSDYLGNITKWLNAKNFAVKAIIDFCAAD